MILATIVYVIFKHDPERMSRYSFLPSPFLFYNSLYFSGKLTALLDAVTRVYSQHESYQDQQVHATFSGISFSQ